MAEAAEFFLITSKLTGLALGIDATKLALGAGAAVVLQAKDANKDHLLWYEDPDTSTIRNKLNDLVLELAGGLLVVNKFVQGNTNQQWRIANSLFLVNAALGTILHIKGDLTFGILKSAVEAIATQICFIWNFEKVIKSATDVKPVPVPIPPVPVPLPPIPAPVPSVPGEFFLISSKLTGLALAIQEGKLAAGAAVVLLAKDATKDNQLWYQHPDTGTIRSKVNDLVLELIGGQLLVKEFVAGNLNQQFKFVNGLFLFNAAIGHIIHVKDDLTLGVKPTLLSAIAAELCFLWLFESAKKLIENPDVPIRALPILEALGDCKIFIQPASRWGDDAMIMIPDQSAVVDVNEKRVWTGNLFFGCYQNKGEWKVGVNTMILDPDSGTVGDIRQWNTWGDIAAAPNLRRYLETLSIDTIVIGVTLDDPFLNIQPVLALLAAFGVHVHDLQLHGNFAFVLRKGHVEETVFIKSLTPKLAPWLTINQTIDCKVVVQPRGRFNDAGNPDPEAFVNVNKQRVWTAAIFNPPGKWFIGVNTMILDPVAGQVSDVRQWNTWGTVCDATYLTVYLQRVPKGAIVIGVSFDDPTKYLAPALPTLKELGVPVDDVQYRGDFAFVTQIGFPLKTKFVKGLTANVAPKLSVSIKGLTQEDIIISLTK